VGVYVFVNIFEYRMRPNADLDGQAMLDGGVVRALFSAVIPMRFSPDVDIHEIGYFIIDYGLRYPKEAPRVPIREGQALVRTVLG
jgi:hypothetical protein